MDAMEKMRLEGAMSANADDAAIWRWFAYLLEERRIRWRFQFGDWHVSVDRRHVARESTFDLAIRQAKAVAEARGVGLLQFEEKHRAATREKDRTRPLPSSARH